MAQTRGPYELIDDTEVDAESPITESLMFRLRDQWQAALVQADPNAAAVGDKLLLPQAAKTAETDTSKVLTPNGSGDVQWQSLTSLGTAMRMAVFTANGSWVVPTGVDRILVHVQGAGGGGGDDASSGDDCGAGGGGGECQVVSFSGVSGDTFTVTIGSGGAGGSTSNGSAGTASSVNNGSGKNATANPGGGGQRGGGTAGSGGSGGAVAGADASFSMPGQAGQAGGFSATNGGGGDAHLGHGGQLSKEAGRNYGGGGAGNFGGSGNGGDGSNGLVVIYY